MERIILDVDLAMGAPGSDIDDGFALALALADPDITVDLVTTVNGNTDVETVTVLTLELLHRLRRSDIPVHRGAQVPLIRPQARFGTIPDDVEVRDPQPTPAAVAMVDHVLAHPGEITLVAVGPLTNVALAMRLNPSFARALKRLVIMGGVFDRSTNKADRPGEFNVWNDPEAAHVVLTSGIAAWWVGLDVTVLVRLTRRRALEMQESASPFESFAGRYTVAWIDHRMKLGLETDASCAMHDPVAVASVTHPELLAWTDAYVQVETGDRMQGAMLADYNIDQADRAINAHVAREVNAASVSNFFQTRLKEM
ncbi:nucleoside hydrolase [Spelaeicoccus albus]|uniref:Inosine-uridine nucleoside N-ribohydrolase n=1 Tax=Spelaeicoccus albus TaxID=1280376 RepID=A0A7Z0AB86_9MICO|nr:nucleoside hydrolase [Spelaeicoccus albus]NYI66945.1 inosine-uridine nucleoside N-ribohydrolase [Spelaeicoccus albus]